ncbi:helix-turn-helix transcriptional regulator [Gymnodinialimonas ceratoperidinii]|uniref:YafY family transcriptional regulator n=1 Tax=Gymnodinialimonas ceratoperidinii TaxID=2856823 RepID=A0A8F6YCQ0_9RHOB|nr:YafY family protein [Gymnodinialimonas ceratoperidinii]QXT39580.1 YafY family transcriptional regulator [Gymnodinialimonas ceratoperidinii]
MRRADRLFRLIDRLRPGKLTTARALAEAMEVSERTIYRDIAHLQASGVPIDGEAGLGYMMRDGYNLPPLMFTEEEIVALSVGARMLRTWGGTSMARGADSALAKITSVLPDATRTRAERLRFEAWTTSPLDAKTRATIDTVEAAIQAPERLAVDYRDDKGAETERILRPLGLWFWGSVWTLVAWCELRQAYRMFRLDRIAAARSLGIYTPLPTQSLEHFYETEFDRGHRSITCPSTPE